MARLTEEMVVARTKQSDIGQVTKLNCWGTELGDVRLLRRMQNVEVLSLSVNKIRSLEDFQYCRNLVELFVRKNEIGDLNQILYLQELPRLRNLWLEENPCADDADYRYTVLRALPNLKTLDKKPVEPEEIQDAMRRGRELVHPESGSQEDYWERGYTGSPPRDASPQQTELNKTPLSPPSLVTPIVTSPSSAALTPATPVLDSPRGAPESDWSYDDIEETSTRLSPQSQGSITRRNTPAAQFPRQNDSSSNGQRSPPRCAGDPPSGTFTRKTSRDYIMRNGDDMPVGGGPRNESNSYYCEPEEPQYQRQPVQHPAYDDSSYEDETAVVLRNPGRANNGVYHDAHMDSSSDGSGGIYRERSRPVSGVEDDTRQIYERSNRQAQERLTSANQRVANDRFVCNAGQRAPYPRRPITRSSNLLSAVLCLVKELDYPSLEVVEMAVKCRMDEMED